MHQASVKEVSLPQKKALAATPKHGYVETFAAQPVGSGAELVTIEADLARALWI
jgi:hypothetical protein